MGQSSEAVLRHHWHVVGISARGIAHIKQGMPCQDSHVWQALPGGAVVVAVADGAGSASLSQLGSARAALAAVEWVAELMKGEWPQDDTDWRDMLTAALETAHDSVLVAANKRKVNPRELATTLIVTVATPQLAVAAQVGDGAAIVMNGSSDPVCVTAPQSGEFINETIFFTSPGYLKAVQFGVWRGEVTGLGVISDGLQRLALKMPEAVPHAAFFSPLLQFLYESEDLHRAEQQLRDFLASDRIRQRADDDLTLVLGALHQVRDTNPPPPEQTAD
jgi:hypothetical protein